MLACKYVLNLKKEVRIIWNTLLNFKKIHMLQFEKVKHNQPYYYYITNEKVLICLEKSGNYFEIILKDGVPTMMKNTPFIEIKKFEIDYLGTDKRNKFI